MTKLKPDRERQHRGEASQSPDETMSPNRSDRRRRVRPFIWVVKRTRKACRGTPWRVEREG
jgi:hypothetical protein